MKTETRTKEKITKECYTVFIAQDGTEFTKEEYCLEYEKGAECAYKTLLKEVLTPLWAALIIKQNPNKKILIKIS